MKEEKYPKLVYDDDESWAVKRVTKTVYTEFFSWGNEISDKPSWTLQTFNSVIGKLKTIGWIKQIGDREYIASIQGPISGRASGPDFHSMESARNWVRGQVDDLDLGSRFGNSG